MTAGPFSLAGKTAIVTGAAMGIGFGIARRFVEAGAKVLLTDIDEAAVQRAARQLPEGQAAALRSDIGQDDAGDRMVAACVERFGGLDCLVNNAGIYPRVPLLKMSNEQFDAVWRVNLRGLVFASRAAGRQLAKQGRGGSILNISSIDSIHPSMVGLAAYDASKGAVNMFTRAFALEMAPHRVRVNAIAPGGITTEGTSRPLEGSGMTPEQMKALMDEFLKSIPLQRMGTPDDIAWPAVFLASSAADYVTGSVLVVDGGALLG